MSRNEGESRAYRPEFMGSQYVCDAALPSGCVQCGQDAHAFVHNPNGVSRRNRQQHLFEQPTPAVVKQRMLTRAQHRKAGECRVCRVNTPGTNSDARGDVDVPSCPDGSIEA